MVPARTTPQPPPRWPSVQPSAISAVARHLSRLGPGLEDERYPTEPTPASCNFLQPNLVTRAAWSNQDGVGMDFDLRLPMGWYAPSKIYLEVPPALAHHAPTVHAVVHDDGVLIQPHNLLSTRKERGASGSRLGVSHCDGICSGYEEANIGTLDVDLDVGLDGEHLVAFELMRGWEHGKPIVSQYPVIIRFAFNPSRLPPEGETAVAISTRARAVAQRAHMQARGRRSGR